MGLAIVASAAARADARILPRDARSLAKRLHLIHRQGEWWSAVFMIACAVTLALPGDSFAYPSWAAFHRHGMTEAFWTLLFAGVGLGRVVALIVNGYMQLVTPIVRHVASFIGLMTWTGCAWLLWTGTVGNEGSPTLSLTVMIVLALKELANIFLAAADVRIRP